MNVSQFNRILGKELKEDEIRSYQIHNLALSALINDAAFENEFDLLNFKLDETIIAEKTKEMIPQLYNENNQLNEDYLNQFLREQRLKVEDIVQIIQMIILNLAF